jgi:acetyl esterase/lipase
VIHGSNPKYSIPEAIDDIHHAIEYISSHAKALNIDKNRIGMLGDSAGAHLSLMEGLNSVGTNKIKAVAAYFPPSDFLNWSIEGEKMLGEHPIVPLLGAFRFSYFNQDTDTIDLVKDETKINEMAKDISPITHVHKSGAPTLLIVGKADEFIPYRQTIILYEAMQAKGMQSKLILDENGGHDADLVKKYLHNVIAWFDLHLKK